MKMKAKKGGKKRRRNGLKCQTAQHAFLAGATRRVPAERSNLHPNASRWGKKKEKKKKKKKKIKIKRGERAKTIV